LILVDTSVWVEHFRGTPGAEALPEWLDADLILLHPWVLGELVLGGLGRQRSHLADLEILPSAPTVEDREVVELILERKLSGRGIGWVDAHLLASALVARSPLWTLDRRLAEAARGLGITTLDASSSPSRAPDVDG
jgi:hypothetical protein